MAGNTVWWVLGGVVVVGGGIGAYFLLRKDDGGGVGGSVSESGGAGGGGAFGVSAQGLQSTDKPAYEKNYSAAGTAASNTAGVVTAPAPAAAPAPAGNAGSLSLARDVTSIGGRTISGAGMVGTMPNSGLAGIDTAGIANSRNSTPTGTGPALVKAATLAPSIRAGVTTFSGSPSSQPSTSGSTWNYGALAATRGTAPAPTAPPPPPTTVTAPKPVLKVATVRSL